MGFFDLCLRRPVGVSLLMLAMALTGGLAYFFLPVAALPNVDFPTIVIWAALPGADPETMASAVAAPLERRLGQIAGVSEITSSSALGATTIIMQFELTRRVDAAGRDVQAAINAASADLPAGMPRPPGWWKANSADAPILILALTSKALLPGEVYEAADTILAQQLSQVKGVGQVEVNGAEKPAVRIQADPGALAAMGLGLEDLRKALDSANAAGPKGRIDGPGESYVLRVNDQLRKADEYKSVVVATRYGTPIRLDSVSTMIDGVENTRRAGWFDDNPAVLLFVRKQADANVVETVDRIRALLPVLKSWLPPAVDVTVMTDRTRTIRASVEDVEICLAISFGLIVATVFVFLSRLWATLAAAVTVPLAVIGTFGVMYLLGYSLDNLSLMALTVATGFVVDDAIVVVEAISHRMAGGEAPYAAARTAARQIGFTVVSISVSLVAVFIPLLMMGGVIGRLFREFSVTLSVAIAVSAVVSLTLIPVMGAYLAPLAAKPSLHPSWGERLFGTLQRGYDAALALALRHRGLTLLVTCATVAANVLLYIYVPKGFFPQQDTGTIMAIAEAPTTISFQAMTERTRELVRTVLADPAVEHTGSFVGGSSLNQARVFISLKPPSERPDIDRVIARLRRATQHIPGIRLFMVPVQDIRAGGGSAKSQYQYTLQGSNLAALEQAAERLADALRSDPDLRDVNTDLEKGALQSNLIIDRDAASRLGVAMQDIDQALYDAFGQRPVSKIYDAHYTYRVVLEVDPALQQDPSSLAKIYVAGAHGNQVPLATLVRIEHGLKPSAIAHQGQFPAVTLSFSMRPGAPLEHGTAAVQQAMRALRLPADIRGSFQGNARIFAQSLGNQPLLIAAALVAVYIVLGVLYESTIHPLTILSTLPSAGIGAILALWAAGRPLDLIGLIGIILLIGIVKKNAIIMIDYALAAEREHGLAPEQAIREACRLRFRPILMTTLTAILGAVPLAVGGGVGAELRQPLGIAIVGGLIVSQLLTLFTTPAVYLALDRFRPQASRRWIRLDLTPTG